MIAWWNKDQVRSRLFFANGKKEGKQEWYFENAKPEKILFYHDDLFDGECKSWYSDGSLHTVQFFKQGKPIGEHREYYQRKSLSQPEEDFLARIIHYDENGKIHGTEASFYPDGKKQTVVFHDHGLFHGMKKMWGADGSLLEEANYVNGKLEGQYFQRLPDGREIVCQYRNNLKNGLHTIFFPLNQQGEKMKGVESFFENDVLHGLVVEYNDQGIKLAETPYQKGKKSGIAKVFTPSGKVQMTVAFEKDVQEGPITQYFPSGAVFRITPFVSGMRNGEEKTYHEDGSVASVFPYQNDLLQGLAQSWNAAGILVFEAEYQKGQRHGFFKKYYDDGSPYLVEHFVLDVLDGEKRKISSDGKQTVSLYEAGKLIRHQ